MRACVCLCVCECERENESVCVGVYKKLSSERAKIGIKIIQRE